MGPGGEVTMASLMAEVREFRIILIGTPALRAVGVKGVIERIFDKLDTLPCSDHEDRIVAQEERAATNCAVAKERRRILGALKTIVLPGAGGGALVLLARWLAGL